MKKSPKGTLLHELLRSAARSNNLLMGASIDSGADTIAFIILPITLGPGLILEFVKLRAGRILTEKHPALEPPRQDLGQLIFGMSSGRDTKHVVQFFESALLGLVQE